MKNPFLLSLLFAAAAILLLPLAIGDFRAARAQRELAGYLERWERRGWADDAELDAAARAAGVFWVQAPRSPEGWTRLGRIAEFRAHTQRFWPEHYRKSMGDAGAYHGAAVGLRPVSAPAWLSVARTALAAGPADARFERALIQAIRLAPGNVSVLQEAIPLAARAWEGLSAETQRAVVAGTRNALGDDRTRRLWQDAANRLGWERLAPTAGSGPDGEGPTRR